jgi:hypothetical protein
MRRFLPLGTGGDFCKSPQRSGLSPTKAGVRVHPARRAVSMCNTCTRAMTPSPSGCSCLCTHASKEISGLTTVYGSLGWAHQPFSILLEHFSTRAQGRQSATFSRVWTTVHVLIHVLLKRTSRQKTRAKIVHPDLRDLESAVFKVGRHSEKWL